MDLSDWPKPVPVQTRLEAWGPLNGMLVLAHAFAYKAPSSTLIGADPPPPLSFARNYRACEMRDKFCLPYPSRLRPK